MTLTDYSTLLASVLPILASVALYWRFRVTGRELALVMIPSLLYVGFFYSFMIYVAHFYPDFRRSALQLPFRIGAILVIVSILIYAIADTMRYRRLHKEYKKEIEEKP